MVLDKLTHKWLNLPYKLNYRRLESQSTEVVATVVFLHGLASSSRLWTKIVKKLPHNIDAILVDLLGHGQSPRPDWLSYNLTVQAKSLHRTISKAELARQPIIIVGHSLGSLVAIEYALKYHRSVDNLILVAPPIYKLKDSQPMDKALLKAYAALLDNTWLAQKAAKVASKIAAGAAVESETDFVPLASSLQSSIIEQNSYNDIKRLDLPIDIIYGLLDPLVINKNLQEIARSKDNIKLIKIPASHDVTNVVSKIVLSTIDQKISSISGTI